MNQVTITRGIVQSSVIGARPILQVAMLDNEVANGVELLLPPGISANPMPGTDVLVLQVLGTHDHLVALGGDMLGAHVANLQPGEHAITFDGVTYIAFRNDGSIQVNAPNGKVAVTAAQDVTVTSSTKVTLAAPEIDLNGTVKVNGTVLQVP